MKSQRVMVKIRTNNKVRYSMYVYWFLTDQQTPMIWRGPMVTSAIKTFTQGKLERLDFIIIDMPQELAIHN